MNDEVKQGEAIAAAATAQQTAQRVNEAEQGSAAAQQAAEPESARRDAAQAAAGAQNADQSPEQPAEVQPEAPAGAQAAAGADVPPVPDEESPEFRALQKAVAEGRDLSKELEPTAAGESGGGGGDSIEGGVRFALDPNSRDPQAGFDPNYTPPPLPDPTANTSPELAAVVPPRRRPRTTGLNWAA
jgi:hypothetical protein